MSFSRIFIIAYSFFAAKIRRVERLRPAELLRKLSRVFQDVITWKVVATCYENRTGLGLIKIKFFFIIRLHIKTSLKLVETYSWISHCRVYEITFISTKYTYKTTKITIMNKTSCLLWC
jgi:hypothetical protein